ncbi:MAG TPA: TIGR00730 family Rossman fold protein [Achromobacter sp.]|nr:TIGR00730 family Rossman fold protein [Achromobacter sp.]
MNLKNICVYCGSNPGTPPEYIEQARVLARELVKRDLGLVYGGSVVGIMGVVANEVLAAGGRVIGVIPELLQKKEQAHRGLTELHLVQNMHERKAMMIEKSDGFIALPGGAGTLEEFFEVWTWAQLNMHQKPCGLLNVAGYYDALVQFVDHAVDEAFIRPQHRDMLVVEEDPALLLDRYAIYEPPNVSKWFDPITA